MPMNGQSKCWLAQNLGADRQANSNTDNSEAAAGWYWQFNRLRGYSHDGLFTRTPATTWNQQISENSIWQTVNDPCNILLGSGWRIPTLSEWQLLANSEKWIFDASNLFNGVMRMHAGGMLNKVDGELLERSGLGRFWSSNQGLVDRGYFYNYSPIHNTQIFLDHEKTFAFSIRCIRN
jgi:uncharacterized protein (TIGR02145 family)